MKDSDNRQLSGKKPADTGRKHEPARFYFFPGLGSLRSALHFLTSRYFLRKASLCHSLVFTQGRPSIENKGYLEIGQETRIVSNIFRSRLEVKKGARLVIGHNCHINGAIIAATESVVIGNNCCLAPFTHILDGDFHGLSDRHAPWQSAPIVIEDDAWVGARSTVLKGVCIGRGAIVAPGAVVTRNVEAYTMVGGVPATVLRRLPRGKKNQSQK